MEQFKNLTDIEIINGKIRNRGQDGIVRIGKREAGDGRDYWLIDSAITLPSHTTLILDDCTVQLSDRCRDNMIRSGNVGIGIDNPSTASDIHIKGIGNAVLKGADHPRSTGDSSKPLANPCPFLDDDLIALAPWVSEEEKRTGNLEFWTKHLHSFGTDAGKPGERQFGDWRNIGILFGFVSDFSIEGIKIVESHGWGISLESCTNGKVSHIEFDARMSKNIDGMLQNIENEDGINLRNGCSFIEISDITGQTGDDVIALTAIKSTDRHQNGDVASTHVLTHDWSRRYAGIHDVLIRNVTAASTICLIVRLLPCETEIYNVSVENITDTRPESCYTTLLVGEADASYGKVLPHSVYNFKISHVQSNSRCPIMVRGYMEDTVISDVRSTFPDALVYCTERENAVKNVTVNN